MKTHEMSKELKVVTDEFVVYLTNTVFTPTLIRFTKHVAYVSLQKRDKLITHKGLQTNCKIIIPSYQFSKARAFKGSTICGPSDKYNEIAGMKIALERAMELYYKFPPLRSQIWAAFHAWVRENYE